MKFSKQVTINIGQFQSVKLSCEEAPSFKEADQVIINELQRLRLPVNSKIKQVLQWNTAEDADAADQ